jgi:trehalose/maltose transport system permease protein
MTRGIKARRRGAETAAWLCLAPALALVGGLLLLPIVEALRLSVYRVWLQAPGERAFIGLENYLALLAAPRFWNAFRVTLLFLGVSVAAELTLGLGLALLLHRRFPGQGMARAAALLPWALPTVVSGLMWGWIFHDRYGIANRLLMDLGLLNAPLVWLGAPGTAFCAAVVADVWKATPYVALILLAGLQSIGEDLWEAARLDGAAGPALLRRIILPLLRPALAVALLFRALDAFRVFDVIYVLTRGGPGGATETLALLTYQTLFQDLDFGRGAALAVMLFAANLGLSLLLLRLLLGRGEVEEGSG